MNLKTFSEIVSLQAQTSREIADSIQNLASSVDQLANQEEHEVKVNSQIKEFLVPANIFVSSLHAQNAMIYQAINIIQQMIDFLQELGN